jgi:hypothetical protein
MFLPPSPQEPFPYLAEMESVETTEYGTSRSLSTSFINSHLDLLRANGSTNSNFARHNIPAPQLGRVSNSGMGSSGYSESVPQLSSSPTIISVLQTPDQNNDSNNRHIFQQNNNTSLSHSMGSFPRYPVASSRNPGRSAFSSALGAPMADSSSNQFDDLRDPNEGDADDLQFAFSLGGGGDQNEIGDVSREMEDLSMQY